ncbi:hypothetical protein LCGC14_1549780 [marine sediment metagenome]|uniref:Uncharacterized protein n=1 Tax=marine sediment metagenome TaxID=412755 RepID=A0A0F9LRG4_9ZZZZ
MRNKAIKSTIALWGILGIFAIIVALFAKATWGISFTSTFLIALGINTLLSLPVLLTTLYESKNNIN